MSNARPKKKRGVTVSCPKHEDACGFDEAPCTCPVADKPVAGTPAAEGMADEGTRCATCGNLMSHWAHYASVALHDFHPFARPEPAPAAEILNAFVDLAANATEEEMDEIDKDNERMLAAPVADGGEIPCQKCGDNVFDKWWNCLRCGEKNPVPSLIALRDFHEGQLHEARETIAALRAEVERLKKEPRYRLFSFGFGEVLVAPGHPVAGAPPRSLVLWDSTEPHPVGESCNEGAGKNAKEIGAVELYFGSSDGLRVLLETLEEIQAKNPDLHVESPEKARSSRLAAALREIEKDDNIHIEPVTNRYRCSGFSPCDCASKRAASALAQIEGGKK